MLWGGGPCDSSVSPSPLDFDFGLGLDNHSWLMVQSSPGRGPSWSRVSCPPDITIFLGRPFDTKCPHQPGKVNEYVFMSRVSTEVISYCLSFSLTSFGVETTSVETRTMKT